MSPIFPVFGATSYWFLPSVSPFRVHFGTKFVALVFENHPVAFHHVKSGLATIGNCLSSVHLIVSVKDHAKLVRLLGHSIEQG